MPYSTYSKINDLLTILDLEGPKDIFELATEIHEGNVESFRIRGGMVESFAVFRRDQSGQIVTRRSLKFGHKKQNLVSSPVWKTKSKLVRYK